MGANYKDYNDGLRRLSLENLEKRRDNLCHKFAENCLKTEKVKGIFKKHELNHKMRKRETKLFALFA